MSMWGSLRLTTRVNAWHCVVSLSECIWVLACTWLLSECDLRSQNHNIGTAIEVELQLKQTSRQVTWLVDIYMYCCSCSTGYLPMAWTDESSLNPTQTFSHEPCLSLCWLTAESLKRAAIHTSYRAVNQLSIAARGVLEWIRMFEGPAGP